MAAPSEQIVLLTGASGFIGSHILEEFLSKGYNIRCAVRSSSSAEAVKKAHPQQLRQISFVTVPDLAVPHAFDEAVKGVSGIVHCANTVGASTGDNERDILHPLINGITNILKDAAASKNPSLTRVVLISSFVAVLDYDKGHRPGYTYSDTDWNPGTYEAAASHQNSFWAFCAAEALAEKAAWDFVKTASPKSSFTLSTICPPWAIGPNINNVTSLSKINKSTELIYNLINSSQSAPPPTDLAAFADVRDIASAFCAAYEKPAAGGERFLVSSGSFSYQTVCDIIRSEFPQLADKVPVGTPGAGEKENVYRLDSSKAASILGLKYHTLKESVRDCVRRLLELEAELKQ